jgi:hypothetical protein
MNGLNTIRRTMAVIKMKMTEMKMVKEDSFSISRDSSDTPNSSLVRLASVISESLLKNTFSAADVLTSKKKGRGLLPPLPTLQKSDFCIMRHGVFIF